MDSSHDGKREKYIGTNNYQIPPREKLKDYRVLNGLLLEIDKENKTVLVELSLSSGETNEGNYPFDEFNTDPTGCEELDVKYHVWQFNNGDYGGFFEIPDSVELVPLPPEEENERQRIHEEWRKKREI